MQADGDRLAETGWRRQADRDRQAARLVDKQAGRQAGRWGVRQADRQGIRQADRQAGN